ncbi:hypothetical protein LSPH24S_09693 [Lysinibacillus sphaericus]
MTQLANKVDVFQAIADPTRRHVLQLLASSDKPIALIADHFTISRTAVVKHLHVLEQAELVSAQKKGREKIYTLDRLKRLKTGYNILTCFGIINWRSCNILLITTNSAKLKPLGQKRKGVRLMAVNLTPFFAAPLLSASAVLSAQHSKP